MAIDSALKRASIAAIGSLFIGPSVIADGSFDQADRQTIGYGYAGILAGAPVVSGDHLRKQLRDAVESAVTGLTTTGANVFVSRTLPIWATLPALCIFTSEEVATYDLGRMGCTPMRVVTLTIEGYHKGGDDDTLDQIALEVETAVFADTTFGGLAQYLVNLTQTLQREGDGEESTGVITMLFEIAYRAADGAPSVAL